MPANANCGLWRPIARLPAADVPAGGANCTPLSDPSSAQQSDAVSMVMPLYDKRYRDKLRSHRVEQLHRMKALFSRHHTLGSGEHEYVSTDQYAEQFIRQ